MTNEISNDNFTILHSIMSAIVLLIGVAGTIFFTLTFISAFEFGMFMKFIYLFSQDPGDMVFYSFILIAWPVGLMNSILFLLSSIIFFLNKPMGSLLLKIFSVLSIVMVTALAFFIHEKTGSFDTDNLIIALIIILLNVILFLIYPGKIKRSVQNHFIRS